jgi:hypothetical protein
MEILVDSSVWIDYFRGGDKSLELEALIDENLVATNDIILAELIPFLKLQKQPAVIRLLQQLTRLPLQINWEEIIEFQVKCLKAGANGIGIPDLIIAQNAKANNRKIYSLDRHFHLLHQVIKVPLF